MRVSGRLCHLLWVALVCASAACHDPNAYIISPSNADSILTVKLDKTSIPADGVSIATITATIAGASASDKRELTFTTTGGTLISGKQESTEVKATVDVAGVAVVSLRADTTIRTVQIDVKVQSVVRSATVAFTAPVADQTFTLTTDKTSIPADGFSTATLTVNFVGAGPTSTRQVDFQTSVGTLMAPGQTSGTKISVTATPNGVATAQLQSIKNAGTAHLTVSAMNVTRTLDIVFGTVDPNSIIRLATSNTVLEADGKSTARLTATIAAGVPDGKRTVRFRTTAGKFLPEGGQDVTRPADSSQQAKVDLQVDSATGFARVSAEVDGTLSNDVGISFVSALPERIVLSAPTTTVAIGGSIVIKATLQRDIGKVSEGLNVIFTASDPFGGNVGDFGANVLTDANGIAQATFFPGAGASPGTVTITARVEGGTAVGTLRLTIQ